MARIKKISYLFRLIFQCVFFIVPITTLLFWVYAPHIPQQYVPFGYMNIQFTPSIQVLAFLVSMILTSLIMFGLYQLIMIFKSYESGQIFTLENVKCYRRLGYTLFIWPFAEMLYEALLSLVLTLHNPPGQHYVNLSVNTHDLTSLIIGGVIILISWIMAEGYRLADEQAHTI